MQIVVMSPHGRFEISNWRPDQTLAEICLANRLPANAVSMYLETDAGLELITNLMRPVRDLVPENCNLVLRPDRNIDYHSVIPSEMISDLAEGDVSEYVFSSDEHGHVLKGMTSEECKAFVYDNVKAALAEHDAVDTTAPIVVGVSGGGDSNVLLGALLAAGVKNLLPVMMMGIPDWDRGRGRAEEICAAHGLGLRIVNSEEVGEALGVKPGRNWVLAFEETYPEVDLEMLGTLAVRLTLAAVAKEVGGKTVITGLNMEDVLAEAFVCVLEGERPLSYPVRQIGDINMFYPLYKCPKKIIDGCYPKYSLANYEDRYPSHLKGRALAYYLAQSMNVIIPGIEFDLLRGFQKLSGGSWSSMQVDQDLGFTVLRPISEQSKQRWKAFQGK